ncbi:MAG: type II toxin-antitoxin system HicB family antitoxin [Desulfovibrio sp.]|nr:type II toxin-antitoxin system HicB family antitoxin [Desulfovibrio sp.]
MDFYLESCAKMGHEPNKPYSGRVTLRMPPDLHARLAVQAEASGNSLNNWLVTALNKSAAQHA